MRGRYLVHFGPLNAALTGLDAVLAALVRRPARPSLPPSPRILVSQPGHLGDVVIATALLGALKGAFPSCRVGFLVGSWSRRVLEAHPDVDRVHVHDHALLNRARGWRLRLARHRETRRQALQEIRESGYDAAIELSFNFPNNVALLYAAAVPVRVGYTSGGFGPLLTDPVDWVHRPDDSVLRYHERLLARLVPSGRVGPRLVQASLPWRPAPEHVPAGPGGYTVVHMGSGGALKEWPATHWDRLVTLFLAQGRRLVFTGAGAEESARVVAIVRGRSNCIDLCSRLDWPEFVGTVANAGLVVAVDSAAGHVAAAFDVPTLTIAHGMTDAALYQPQSPANVALRNAVPCLPCYRSRGCPSMDCIRGVSAGQVFEAADR